MQTLPLTAQFFLLSIDSQKTTFAQWHYLPSFSIGLSGAFLFDLLLTKRLVISEQKEFIEDKNVPCSSAWAEKILLTIEEKRWFRLMLGKNYQKTLGNWLKVLNAQLFDIKENTKQDLKQQAILAEKPAKLLGIKLYNSIYLKNTDVLLSLKANIEQAILNKNTTDLLTLMLLRLIKGTKTISLIFAEKTKIAQKELEQGLEALFQKEEIIDILKELLAESRQPDIDELSDALEVIADAIDSIGDAVDSGSDGGSSDGGGGGDGD